MLTLHGFAFSNYYNIVKHALMAKGVPFRENLVYPGSPELLAVNPAGKVPAMTTARGTLLAKAVCCLSTWRTPTPTSHCIRPTRRRAPA